MPSPFPPAPPLPWPPQRMASAPVGLPVGTVLAFAGEVTQQATPLWAQGFLVCDGRELPVSQFHELFLVIRYLHSPSAAAGGGTFHLPDLQGYFLRGVDPMGTIDPDYKDRTLPDIADWKTKSHGVGSRQESAFQDHEHSYVPVVLAGATSEGEGGTVGAEPTSTSGVVPKNLTSTETRPINKYVYYIIKYTNHVFPHHLTALSSGVGGGG